jgi:hypothetical protein
MLDLSRRAGRPGASAWPPLPRVREAARSLLDLAIENATSGCVAETHGVWVALHQSKHAEDPRVRRALAGVARDEARHAALAWRVFDWLDGRLSESERGRVRDASARALAAAERPLPVHHDVARALGLPAPGCC